MRSHRFALLAIASCAALCSSCGPRMRVQPSIQPFEQRMPAAPAHVVPTTGSPEAHALAQSKLAKNPIAATRLNRENGRIYYGYYCLSCHGKKGDGNGPVGESYVPKPTDLSSPSITAMTDGQLYLAMLKGEGHEPIMLQTVPPEHRWPLVLHVRGFAQSPVISRPRTPAARQSNR